MLHRAFNTWQKRLTAVVIATLISAAWLPTVIYLKGSATTRGLISPMDCYMEPEFYRDGGVSAKQFCSGGQLDQSTLVSSMVQSLETVGLTVALTVIILWIVFGMKHSIPEPTPEPVTPSEPPIWPTYANHPSNISAS